MKKKTLPLIYAGRKQESYGSAVIAGDLVWASGMSGLLFETGKVRSLDPAQQTVDALDKVKHNLEEAGTSLENVVGWNWYVKDTCRDRDAIELAARDYVRKNAPALAENMPTMVWVGVRELYYPEMVVEIGNIAAVLGSKERIKTYPLIYAGKKQESYSSAKVVGDLVWASGMSGRLFETGQVGTPDPAQQTIDTLDKIKHNLEEAGTSLENVVRWNLYVKDNCRDVAAIVQALKDYVKKNAPALAENMPVCTGIGVRELYYPDMLVELGDIAAVIGDKEKIKTYPYFYAGEKIDWWSSTKIAGNVVWAAGMSGRLPETGQVGTPDVAQQTIDSLKKVKHNLEEAGSSLENIVSWNWYAKDTCRDRDAIELTARDYIRKNAPALAENMPAMTWIGVRELFFPTMLVEFEPTAIIPG